MTLEPNNSNVRVEIFDQAFSLRGDPDYMIKLAQYVGSKMRAIAETHTVDNFSLAVLTALKIAHEYYLLKRKVEGEDRGTSGEEGTTEEADSSDSQDAEAIKGQPRKTFTEEDGQRACERRKRHHTRRWYEKQLLAIANGELNPTREQHKALLAVGRGRGWNRRPSGKRQA